VKKRERERDSRKFLYRIGRWKRRRTKAEIREKEAIMFGVKIGK
jgi:hypothetical protein